jgi:hypothetical protein
MAAPGVRVNCMKDWKLPSISSVARTLSDFKSLSVEGQSCLLLRRLATLYTTESQTFHKGNMRHPQAMDIAFGFPENEKVSAMDFLLARPWQELLNAGQITDKQGNGFFSITQDGYRAAAECESVSNAPDPGPPAEIGNRGRIADLRFRKSTADLYEGTIQRSKDLVDQYSNEGVASAPVFLRKVADAVLTQFKTIERLFEAAYAIQFENERITPAVEHWLRIKAKEAVESEIERAQRVTESLSLSFAGPAAGSFRLEGEGRMMLRRLDDSITLLKLANDERAESTTAPTLGAKKPPITREATHRGLSVFISHSSKDKDLALALIDLLKAGLGLLADQIRCSSVDGYRLPVGVNTEDQLREEVNAAKVVVGLITPSSLASYYVMFELGARWGANLFLAPLLAGVKASELSGPLSLLNALSASSDAQLHQLLGDVAKHLGLPRQPAESYIRNVTIVKTLSDAIVSPTTAQPAAVAVVKQKLRVTVSAEGNPPSQVLRVVANRPVEVSRVDYMLSSEAAVAGEDVSAEGDKIEVPINDGSVLKVWNTPRADRNHYDHSGPAKIAITVSAEGDTNQYILPVQMESTMLGNTMHRRIVGSKTFFGSV